MTKDEIYRAIGALIDVAERRLSMCGLPDCRVCAENRHVLEEAKRALQALLVEKTPDA